LKNNLFLFQKGFDATQQREIDEFLIQEDGTENKSKSFYLFDYIIRFII
jgi:enolase